MPRKVDRLLRQVFSESEGHLVKMLPLPISTGLISFEYPFIFVPSLIISAVADFLFAKAAEERIEAHQEPNVTPGIQMMSEGYAMFSSGVLIFAALDDMDSLFSTAQQVFSVFIMLLGVRDFVIGLAHIFSLEEMPVLPAKEQIISISKITAAILLCFHCPDISEIRGFLNVHGLFQIASKAIERRLNPVSTPDASQGVPLKTFGHSGAVA